MQVRIQVKKPAVLKGCGSDLDIISPGGLLVGTDSPTPNAGGMTMLGMGIGSPDVVNAMSGQQWELPSPKILGVRLIGKLTRWAS